MIPLTDRVVMRQWKVSDKTKAGLYIPETTKGEKPNVGEVLYIGPDVKTLKVGHIVALGKNWFTNFKLKGEDLLILNEPDIVGILEGHEIKQAAEDYNNMVVLEELGQLNG